MSPASQVTNGNEKLINIQVMLKLDTGSNA